MRDYVRRKHSSDDDRHRRNSPSKPGAGQSGYNFEAMLAYDRAMRESRDINSGETVHPKLEASQPKGPAERKEDRALSLLYPRPKPGPSGYNLEAMLAYDRAMREGRDVNSGATQGVTVHPKLQVSSPNDPAEREADAIADTVMRMPEPANASCSTCGTPIPDDSVHRKCATCDEEEQIQPKHQNSTNSGMTVSGPTADGIRNLSGGQPIPEVDRNFMEPRFGRDFSDVRLHTGTKASELSESINARAFTHGNNIAFKGGEYQPGTERGRRLLAHELGHVGDSTTSVSSVYRQPCDATQDGSPNLAELDLMSDTELAFRLLQAIDFLEQPESLQQCHHEEEVVTLIQSLLNERMFRSGQSDIDYDLDNYEIGRVEVQNLAEIYSLSSNFFEHVPDVEEDERAVSSNEVLAALSMLGSMSFMMYPGSVNLRLVDDIVGNGRIPRNVLPLGSYIDVYNRYMYGFVYGKQVGLPQWRLDSLEEEVGIAIFYYEEDHPANLAAIEDPLRVSEDRIPGWVDQLHRNIPDQVDLGPGDMDTMRRTGSVYRNDITTSMELGVWRDRLVGIFAPSAPIGIAESLGFARHEVPFMERSPYAWNLQPLALRANEVPTLERPSPDQEINTQIIEWAVPIGRVAGASARGLTRALRASRSATRGQRIVRPRWAGSGTSTVAQRRTQARYLERAQARRRRNESEQRPRSEREPRRREIEDPLLNIMIALLLAESAQLTTAGSDDGTGNRNHCKLRPAINREGEGYHKGGNVRHDLCANIIPPNEYGLIPPRGADALLQEVSGSDGTVVQQKFYDAKTVAKPELWEIKTGQQRIGRLNEEISIEYPFAQRCGYDYSFGIEHEGLCDRLARRHRNKEMKFYHINCDSGHQRIIKRCNPV